MWPTAVMLWIRQPMAGWGEARQLKVPKGNLGNRYIRSSAKKSPARTPGLKIQQDDSADYLMGANLNFCPPTEASYINPPFALVKMARPSV